MDRLVSKIMQKKIEEMLDKGIRLDSRKLLELRKIDAQVGIIKKAEGSARVKLGDTEVLAGIKLGVGEPYTESPEEGTLITTAELNPLASEEFETGPPRINAIEIARIVDRGVRESSFIDFKKLCVKKGEAVWTIFLDIYPLNDDGNLIDACALAAVLALKNAVFPKLTDENKVDYGNLTSKHLPLTDNVPVTVTTYKVDNKIILDPIRAEEKSAKARLSIAVSRDKEAHINAMQKSGDALTEDELMSMIEHSIKESKKILDIIEKVSK